MIQLEYCYAVPNSDELTHYGVKGMHWGIRRYQPYPNDGPGRFARKKATKQGARFIADINQRKRNEEVRKVKQSRKVGDISRKEFVNKRRDINDKYKTQNRKEIEDFAKKIQSDKSYKQSQQRVSAMGKKAYKEIPNYGVKKGVNNANRALTGALAGVQLADVANASLMLGAGIVAPELAIPAIAIGTAGYGIGTTTSHAIRRKIIEKNL